MPGVELNNFHYPSDTTQLISSSWPGLAVSAEDLRHVPSNLRAYRRRIDAGVEEQRRQREILETLQDKILQCRLKNAHERGSGSLSPRPAAVASACRGGQPCFRCRSCTELWDLDDHSDWDQGGYLRHYETQFSQRRQDYDQRRPRTTEAPYSSRRRRQQRKVRGADSSDDASDRAEILIAPLRSRLNESLAINEALSADVVQLNTQLQQLAAARHREAELHAEKLKHQKCSNEKLRNRLHEFWIECSTLKRKMNDISEDIKSDLAAQRPDLTRVGRVFIRLLQQARAQEAEREHLFETQRLRLEELQRQCIELNVANAQLRSDVDDGSRRVTRSEDALRRAADERRQLAACLREIRHVPKRFNQVGAAANTSANAENETAETIVALCGSTLTIISDALRQRSASVDALRRTIAAENAKRTAAEERFEDAQTALTTAQGARRVAEENAHALTLERDELARKNVKLKQKLADLERVHSDRLAAVEQQLEFRKSEYETRIADFRAEHNRTIEDFQREQAVRDEEIQLAVDRARRDAESTVAERISRLDAENRTLRDVRDRVEAEAAELQKKLHDANSMSDELRARFESQRAEIAAQATTLDEMRVAVNARDAQIDEWRRQQAATAAEMEARSDELASLRVELTAIETRLDDANSNLQEVILEATRQKSEADSLRNALRSQNEEAKQKLTKLSNENETLAEALASRAARLEKDGEKIVTLRRELTELNKLYDTKSNELSNVVRSLHDAQTRGHAFEDRANEAEHQLTELKRETQKLRDAVRSAEWAAKMSATDARLADEKCKRLAGDLRAERELGRAEVERLERLLDDELSRHLASSRRVEVADVTKTVESMKLDELATFKLQYEALSEDNKRLRQRLTTADGDLEAERAESDALRTEIDTLSRSQRDALAELNAGRQAASASQMDFVMSLERELVEAKARVTEATRREEALNERLAGAETQIERSAEMIRRLYAELEEISEQSDSQTVDTESRLDKLRAELSAKSSQLDGWRQRYEQQRDAIVQFEARLDGKETIVREQHQRLNELEATLVKTRSAIVEERRLHDAASARVNALDNECATLRRTIAESGNVLQSRLDTTLAELADERERLRICETRLRTSESECARLADEKSRLELELSGSMRELEELNRNYRQLEFHEEELTAQLNAEREKRREFETSLVELRAASETLRTQLKRGGDERTLASLLEEVREAERQKFEALRELSANQAELDIYRNRLTSLTQSRDATAAKLRRSRRRVARLSTQLAANERSARRIADFAATQEWTLMPTPRLEDVMVAADRRRHYLRPAPGSSSDRPAPLFVDELSSRTSFMTRDATAPVLPETPSTRHEEIGASDSTATTSLESEKEGGARVGPEPHATPPPGNKISGECSDAVKCPISLTDTKRNVIEPGDKFNSTNEKGNLGGPSKSAKRYTLSKRRLRTLTTSTISSSSTSDSAEDHHPSTVAPDTSPFSSSLEKSFLAMRRRITALELEEARHVGEIRRLQLEFKSGTTENEQLRDRLSEARQNVDRLREKNADLEARLADAHEAARVARAEIQSALAEERRALSAQLTAAMAARAADVTSHEESARQRADEMRQIDAERREMRATEARLRTQCASLELKVGDAMDTLETTRHELAICRQERGAADGREKQLEAQCERFRLKCNDLERRLADADSQLAARVLHTKSDIDESAAQRRAGLIAAESSQKRVDASKCALEEITTRWRTTEQERDQIRRELLDARSRLNTVTAKLNSMQAASIEANAERRRLADRVDFLEKSERHCEALERELVTVNAARTALATELDELKRQLQRATSEARELTAQLDRTRRECAAQNSIVETLQDEKVKMAAATRQASAERSALDASLAAMERQNAELSRQCARLQQQVEQLEREGDDNERRLGVGTGAAEPNLRRKLERLEAEMHRLNQSKRQLEKTISQREQNYTQKLKMYEIQVASLTERLKWEREQVRALKRAGASTHPSLRPSLLAGGAQTAASGPTANEQKTSGPAIYSTGVTQHFDGAQRAACVAAELPLTTAGMPSGYDITAGQSPSYGAGHNSSTVALRPTVTSTVLHKRQRYNTTLNLQSATIATYIRRYRNVEERSSAVEPPNIPP